MFSIAPLGCQEECGSVVAQRWMNGLMAEKQERTKRSVKVLARLLLMNAEAFRYYTSRIDQPWATYRSNPISRDGRSFCRQDVDRVYTVGVPHHHQHQCCFVMIESARHWAGTRTDV